MYRTKQILDPQSATLTNPEVLDFLNRNPPRRPEPKVGGYASADLQGYWTVVKEVHDYTQRCARHTISLTSPPPEKWMRPLLLRLQRFNLTKPELIMLINLGTGLKGRFKNATSAPIGDPIDSTPANLTSKQDPAGRPDDQFDACEADVPADKMLPLPRILPADPDRQVDPDHVRTGSGDEEMRMADEETSDEQVLTAIVEELDQRLSDEDVQELLTSIREVLQEGDGVGRR